MLPTLSAIPENLSPSSVAVVQDVSRPSAQERRRPRYSTFRSKDMLLESFFVRRSASSSTHFTAAPALFLLCSALLLLSSPSTTTQAFAPPSSSAFFSNPGTTTTAARRKHHKYARPFSSSSSSAFAATLPIITRKASVHKAADETHRQQLHQTNSSADNQIAITQETIPISAVSVDHAAAASSSLNDPSHYSFSSSSLSSASLSHASPSASSSIGDIVSWDEVVLPHPVDEPSPVSTWEPVAHHDNITTMDKAILVTGLTCATALFAGLISISGPNAWRYYLAGGVCAAASHIIPVPIDVVKTRKQVDPYYKDMHFLDATKDIVKKEGMRSLLAGLGPTAWGYLFEGSLKFGVYEVLKPIVIKGLGNLSHAAPFLAFLNAQFVAFIVSAALSGMAASLALCPMEGLRIRMVAEPDFAPKGFVQCGYRMLKYEGVSALTKGIWPMLYKQVPYTIVKNVCFDYSARYAYLNLRRYGFAIQTPTVRLGVPLLSAVLASVLSCVSSQPGDMLLSLVNAHGGDRRTREIIRDILKSDRGVRGFFVGIKTRLLHVGLTVTIQLFIYDIVKRFCGIAATGSSW